MCFREGDVSKDTTDLKGAIVALGELVFCILSRLEKSSQFLTWGR